MLQHDTPAQQQALLDAIDTMDEIWLDWEETKVTRDEAKEYVRTYGQEKGDSMDTFFETASPHTLASLIADVQLLGTGAEFRQLQLERRALAVLRANVGVDDAERLVEAAIGAVSE